MTMHSSAFTIIPVIDVMNGVAVHARRGERDQYQPIQSPLCQGSDPVVVAGALLDRGNSQALYMADLDAILGRSLQLDVIQGLALDRPGIDIWVDGGPLDEGKIKRLLAMTRVTVVVGSECVTDYSRWQELQSLIPPERMVLSLDFGPDGVFRGPPELLTQTAIWPDRVIVMTLARVGGQAGPDFDRLSAVKTQAGSRAVYAAGGVRHQSDVDQLQAQGIAGALVATALHDGYL